MDHSSFFTTFGGGNKPCISCRKECDGVKGFSASHPPFSLPSTNYFDGNSDRGFPTCLILRFSSYLGSFTLSDYISHYWDRCSLHCTLHTPHHKAASPILPLTYKTVCQKLYKGLRNVVSVLTSVSKSLYVMLCYVIMIMIIYLSIYLEVIIFKSYDIQESMLCCRQNIARYYHTTG
jgi:hypothetical protein